MMIYDDLTPEERKQKIDSLKNAIYILKKKLDQLVSTCPHEKIKINKHGDSADCLGCGRHDWYCPDSPDHFCHYENGDMDECDYCGAPEERK